MYHSHANEQQRRAEELVWWTCGERIRFLWYWLGLTVQEVAYETELAIAVCTVDGQRFAVGDANMAFCLQSVAV